MLSKKYIITVLATALMICNTLHLYSQGEKKFIRQGNRAYEKENFPESEINYRKALDKNNQLPEAVFNAGDALYRQDKYQDAGKEFLQTSKMTDMPDKKAASLYNLGNSMLMSDNLKESIDAFKESLRIDPSNIQAKHNLAYAQDLLQQQQQQKQNQQDQQQNQENDQNKDGEQNSDQQQSQQQENKEDQQQSISKEDAERLLNALASDEKDIQEKVKLAKALESKTKTLKNW